MTPPHLHILLDRASRHPVGICFSRSVVLNRHWFLKRLPLFQTFWYNSASGGAWLLANYLRRNEMAGEGKKSKTNVAARQEAKSAAQICRMCGKKIDVVMTLTPNGKKMMLRKCCSTAA